MSFLTDKFLSKPQPSEKSARFSGIVKFAYFQKYCKAMPTLLKALMLHTRGSDSSAHLNNWNVNYGPWLHFEVKTTNFCEY